MLDARVDPAPRVAARPNAAPLSKQMVVMTEDMAPGDRIPTHRHPNADELILIRTGHAKVILGDRNFEVHAGGIS